MCICVLPPGDNPIAVNKYINIKKLNISVISKSSENQKRRLKIQIQSQGFHSRMKTLKPAALEGHPKSQPLVPADSNCHVAYIRV
jgi:hypothetical protein